MEKTNTYTTHIITIPTNSNTNTPPPIQTIEVPPPATVVSSPPPPPASNSSPELLDLPRSNHDDDDDDDHEKLCSWNSCFPTKLKVLIGCLESSSEDLESEMKKDEIVEVPVRMMQSPNYYSQMNHEERDEQLKSAIDYCKHSTN
ncbi:hypothetical protein L6452_21639 [Arctium lappa]|uniref:Uncharacterized protein n=1 Tax=Arctium lappa TaxID=4217 RepID=A0ACB9AXL3_ARCLA|nr:hypothetical protein L6452_21639 [Arctium lappa]